MKKLLLLFPVLILFFTTTIHAQDKKVAVVTFYVNKQIDVSDFGTANTADAVLRLANDPNFKLTPSFKRFHDQFFGDCVKDFPLQFLPEEQVINNEGYKDFAPEMKTNANLLEDDVNLPIKGYKVIQTSKSVENEKKLLQMFGDCDGIMKVYVDFDLQKKGFGGVAVVKVNARAHIIIYNKAGDKVFSIKEEALSKISGALVQGIPFVTPKKVQPLCESALDELAMAMFRDLPKLAKKADHKL
ncbi:MAG: hypothetical protein M3O71_22420 [Bacteroidota bacterium]|nr:hypothetical protein [Bacteroidota bacterium]